MDDTKTRADGKGAKLTKAMKQIGKSQEVVSLGMPDLLGGHDLQGVDDHVAVGSSVVDDDACRVARL